MLTRGAFSNLVNRYRAVLKKCRLVNIFGSLAVTSMLILAGTGVARAAISSGTYMNSQGTKTQSADVDYVGDSACGIFVQGSSDGSAPQYNFTGNSMSFRCQTAAQDGAVGIYVAGYGGRCAGG